jgi:hypothetical protein
VEQEYDTFTLPECSRVKNMLKNFFGETYGEKPEDPAG